MIEDVRWKEEQDIKYLLSLGFCKRVKDHIVSYYLDGINIKQHKAWSDYKRYPTIYTVDGESYKNEYDFDSLLLHYFQLNIDDYKNFIKLANRKRVIDNVLNYEEPVEYEFNLNRRFI